ncbi:hypothetical protein ID866_7260 [Astraeus odoratus]|nr:hypothetical protein ID866_7260 [Astraeus odoratus]
MESLRSVGLPAEDNSRVTPPPLSRESSMVSAAHLDASSQGSSSHRVDDNVRSRDAPHPSVVRGRPFPPRIPELRNETGSHLNDSRDVSSSPVHRRRTVDTYSARRLHDTRRDHYLAQPPPTAEDPVHSSNRTEKGPQMHPERAMLLQHVLPPRPQVEPLSHPGRPPRRDKGDGRAESARGDRLRLSTSPQSDRHRSEVDHPSAPSGGSLLDRLTVGGGDRSFYERVQVPTKRDRGEMISGDSALDNDGDGPDGQKRARRRGTKFRKSKFT